jgi:hypothetical protein
MTNNVKYLCDLLTGSKLEIIEVDYLINHVDDLIVALDDPPYYLIKLSLGEFVSECEIYQEYNPDIETLRLLLNYSVHKWEDSGNPDSFIYSMETLWRYFKYPDIMKEYYIFQETVTPHSGERVDGSRKINAINNYIEILNANGVLIQR